ncbi:MAG: hypothetical protein NTZ97_00120 [Candidatus Moranbacteria bacterium]|nr:hypothetical protein [Candidatus Moranbacteria bacterium]
MSKINLEKYPNLKLVKPLKWEEVFDIWRQNEASDPKWMEHYKSRGFATWEAWRETYAVPFKCAEADWGFYVITNPLQDIPNFCGGPFRGWKENHYGEKDTMTFAKLANLDHFQNFYKTEDIIKNFPNGTIISGMEVDGDIYIIEGMHRCLAIALAKKRGLDMPIDIKIALAKSPQGKLPLVGMNLSYKKPDEAK